MAGRSRTTTSLGKNSEESSIQTLDATISREALLAILTNAKKAVMAAGITPREVAAFEANESLMDDPVNIQAATKAQVSSLLRFDAEVALEGLIQTIGRTPTLLLNDDANHNLQRKIIAHLSTEISKKNNLLSAMYGICETCFRHHIPAERVTKFFQSKSILDYLIDTLYQQLPAPADQEKKCNSEEEKQNLLAQIEEKFATLLQIYDPKDRKETMAAFTADIVKQYPYAETIAWLKSKRPALCELLHDNIPKIVDRAYTEIGWANPKEFIQIYMTDFFGYKSSGGESYFTLDLQRLTEFFDNILPNLKTEEISLGQLRALLINSCVEEMRKQMDLDEEDSMEAIKVRISDEFISGEELKNVMYLNTQTSDNFDGMLEDPEFTPIRIQKHYEDWSKDLKRYEDYLKVAYGSTGEEDMKAIEKRATEACKKINDILEKLFKTANLDPALKSTFLVSQEIKDVNSLFDLAELACTADSPEERFAARRKFELAEKLFFANVPRMAFRSENAAFMQKKLIALDCLGVEIAGVPDIVSVYISNDGSEIVIGPEKAPGKDHHKLDVNLVEAKFCGVEGYFTVFEDNGPDGVVWMGYKSEESILTKLLKKHGTIEEMMDLIRATFIVKDPKDMAKIREKMDEFYCGMASNLKSKGKGMKREKTAGNYVKNKDTAQEYKNVGMQYVVKNLVQDEQGDTYHVRFELRFGPPDLLKEKDLDSDISHSKYKEKEARGIITKLAPPQLLTFQKAFYKRTPKGKYILKDEIKNGNGHPPKTPQPA